MPKVANRARKSAMPRTAQRARVVLLLGDSMLAIEEGENIRSVSEVDSRNLVVHFDVPFSDELYRCEVIPSKPVHYKVMVRRKDGVGIQLAARPKKIKIVCEEI